MSMTSCIVYICVCVCVCVCIYIYKYNFFVRVVTRDVSGLGSDTSSTSGTSGDGTSMLK